MSPSRPAPWLFLLPALGVCGWFSGTRAYEGLQPSRRSPSPITPPSAAAREPVVRPSSPEGSWMARVKAARPSEFEALFEEIESLFPGDDSYESRDAAVKWLLCLWITRDLDSAILFVGSKDNNAIGRAFGLVLGSMAPDKVAIVLNSRSLVTLGNLFPAAVLSALADTHPAEFLKLDPHDLGDAYSEQYPRAIKNLAANDPATAAEIWQRRGTSAPNGKEGLNILLGAWVSRDPSAARRWVDSLTDTESRHLAQHAWLGTLAKTDLASARRELAAMDLGAWLPGRPGAMNEPALQYPQDARTIVLAALARVDPAAAIGELETMLRLTGPAAAAGLQDRSPTSPGKVFRDAIAEAAAESLSDDPAELFAALKRLTENRGGMSMGPDAAAAVRLAIVEKKSTAWEGLAALQALQLLAASTPSPADPNTERAEVVQAMLQQQLVYRGINPDPDAAVEFISQMPEAERGRVAQSAFFALGSEQPTLESRIVALMPPDLWNKNMGEQFGRRPEEYSTVMAGLPDTGKGGEARAAFTQTWALEDPEAASRWVTSLSSGAAPAARSLTETWAGYDETAASTWAAALPPGPSRDGAALGLAGSVAAADAEAGWQWAASITDAALSAEAFSQVARRWGREAPPEFRQALSAALDRSGATAENKAAALRVLDAAPSPSP